MTMNSSAVEYFPCVELLFLEHQKRFTVVPLICTVTECICLHIVEVPGLWMVETVESYQSAKALNQRWGDRKEKSFSEENSPLHVMLQVNTSREESKCYLSYIVMNMKLPCSFLAFFFNRLLFHEVSVCFNLHYYVYTPSSCKPFQWGLQSQ